MKLPPLTIKRILAGQTVTHSIPKRATDPKLGRTYAVQHKTNGRAVARATLLGFSDVPERADEPPQWLLTLAVDRSEEARFLKPLVGCYPHHPHDYTPVPALSMRDEGECPSEDDLNRMAMENGRRFETTHAEEGLRRRARTLGRQIREEALRSGKAGIDVTKELEAIEGQLRAMERKRRRER